MAEVGIRFLRRSSTGSTASSRAVSSISRSRTYVASGRPAPRYGAVDVAGDDPDLVLGNLEDVAGERVADTMRVLDVGVEGVAILVRVIDTERAARLHELGVDPGDHVAAADDAVRLREHPVGRGLVAGLEDVADVVGALVPDRRRPGPCGLRRGRHRGEGLVVDLDEIGRVLGLCARLGDDERDRIADVSRAVAREPAVRAREHRRAVRALALQGHRHRAQALDVGAREHREDPGRAQRRRRLDRADPSVRVHRAHDDRVRLAGHVDVVEVAPAAAQEPDIFDPLDTLSDTVLAHQPPPPLITAGAGARRAPQTPSATPRPTCRPAPASPSKDRHRSCSGRRTGKRPTIVWTWFLRSHWASTLSSRLLVAITAASSICQAAYEPAACVSTFV